MINSSIRSPFSGSHLILMAMLIASLSLGGCSASAQVSSSGSSSNRDGTPSWVLNPAEYFSEAKYLMATGSGSTLKEAEADAFSSLSQIFQMDIKASEQVISESTMRTVNNNYYSESTEQLLNNINIGTNQELMNTSILTSDMDRLGTYYALAGMDRAETSRIYQQEIANNKISINEYESNAADDPDVLQQLILYKKALGTASANVILSRQLNIIRGGAASDSESTQTLSRIEENFRQVQQKALVAIITENATETLTAAIADVFQQSGFTITNNENDAMLLARVNFKTQNADMNRDDFEFVKWELIVDVSHPSNARSFNTYMIEGRDGAPSYAAALKRADYSARTKIDKDFNTFLNKELLATQ